MMLINNYRLCSNFARSEKLQRGFSLSLKNWLSKNKIPFNFKTPAFLSWCFVFISFFGKGQVNLVSNPGFEIYSACPNNLNQIKLATGWDTLKAGGGGSPDFFNACELTGTFSMPYNLLSFQYSKSGLGYANIIAFYNQFNDSREYIQSKLLKKLQGGKTYCVTFFANLSNYSTCGVNQMGAYFDDGTINSPVHIVVNGTVNPQVNNSTGNFITDTLNWTKIQGTFIANGNEEYITLGSFKPATLTNTVSVSSDVYKHATYYIDDVSVVEINSKANAGTDALICIGDSTFIGTIEEALDCQWFSNNIQIAQGAGIWVKPTTDQQYIIKQDVCGILSYDTVQVIIKDINCNPIINTEIPNTFTPNGDGINDVWQFSLGADATLSEVEVYNRWGNLIKNLEINNSNYILWDGRTTSGEPCIDGVYFYVLKYTDAKGEQQSKNGYISLFK